MTHDDQRAFFDGLYRNFDGEGVIELRLLKSWEKGGKTVQSLWTTPQDIGQAVEQARRSGKDVYFGVCPRARRDRREVAVCAVPALWVDLDGKDFDAENPLNGKIKAMDLLTAWEFPPSAIIDSGNGWHSYWFLKEIEEITNDEQRLKVKGYLKGVSDALGGDHTFDLSRILRVPGTLNRKNPDVPKQVVIQKLDLDLRYNLIAFDEYWVRIENVKPAAVDLSGKAEIPERFHELLEKDEKIRATWEGNRPDFRDQSRSSYDFSLAGLLARRGFKDGEIAAILKASPSGKGAEATHQYLRHTISWAKAGAVEQPPPPTDEDAPPVSFQGPAMPEPEAQESEPEPQKQECESMRKAKDEGELSSDFVLRCLHSNETGDGLLFQEVHRECFCFDHSAERWYEWAGHYWREDRLDQASEAISAVVKTYGSEYQHQGELAVESAKAGLKDKERKHIATQQNLVKRIQALQSKYRALNILFFATRGRGSLGITGEGWDQDPWLLACINGVIDLKNGSLQHGRPGDYIKTVCPTEFRGLDEPALHWERFLLEIFNEDQELVDYIQRVLGYSVTGLSNQHEFYIMYGKGRNGKGTMFDVLSDVLGPICAECPKEMLLSQRFSRQSGSPTSDIMALRGRRVVYAVETDEGRGFDVSQVKWLVGGDRLVGRELYGKRQVEFKPTHTLFLQTNHKPNVPSDDYALWQRIRLIPFEVSFVDEPNPLAVNERKRDPNLAEKLKREAPGILAWLVRGCLDWQRAGLRPPDSVKAATEEYRADEDVIGQFMAECCDLTSNPNAKLKSSDLYGAYKAWCEANGSRAVSHHRFGREMKSILKWEQSNYLYYLGVELVEKELHRF